MSDITKAIRKIVTDSGFASTIDRAIVLAVDKNELTCSVQLITDETCIIDDVKLKPVINDGDLAKMGLVIFPKVQSMVIVGQVDNDNTDVVVLSVTEIESIAMDTATAFKMLFHDSGHFNLNAVKMVFNDGKNRGLPLLMPLTEKIKKLQEQVNELITAFKAHTHPGVSPGGGTTQITATAAPGKTENIIKPEDIENKVILQ